MTGYVIHDSCEIVVVNDGLKRQGGPGGVVLFLSQRPGKISQRHVVRIVILRPYGQGRYQQHPREDDSRFHDVMRGRHARLPLRGF